jgi:hypothetical protein
MSGLFNLLAGIGALGLLFSGDDELVPIPKTAWHDDVGESIVPRADASISKFNSAAKNCKSTLEDIRTQLDLTKYNVDFTSRESALEFYRSKLDNISLSYLS